MNFKEFLNEGKTQYGHLNVDYVGKDSEFGKEYSINIPEEGHIGTIFVKYNSSHISFKPEWTGKKLGPEALKEILIYFEDEIYFAKGRIINKNLIKMINKLPKNTFSVIEDEHGYTITLNN